MVEQRFGGCVPAGVGCSNLRNVEAGVQALADTIQHRERAHHESEGRWKSERLHKQTGHINGTQSNCTINDAIYVTRFH